MKKLYMEILKISLVFILGLFAFGILNQVNATESDAVLSEKMVLVDAKGVKFKELQYVKYRDMDKKSGLKLYTYLNSAYEKDVIGVIESGTIFQVKTVLDKEGMLEVRIIEGKLKGKVGCLKITRADRGNFEILEDYEPRVKVEPGIGEGKEIEEPIPKGIKGILDKVLNAIMNLLKNLFKF